MSRPPIEYDMLLEMRKHLKDIEQYLPENIEIQNRNIILQRFIADYLNLKIKKEVKMKESIKKRLKELGYLE